MTKAFLFFASLAFLSSCNSNTNTETAGLATDSVQVAVPIERPDQLDRTTMTQTYSNSGGGGDCDIFVKKYQKDSVQLVVDSTDCYEFRQGLTYYLLSKKGEVQMVQVKDSENSLDEAGVPYSTLTETIYDFRGGKTIIREKSGTLSDAKRVEGEFVLITENREDGTAAYWQNALNDLLRLNSAEKE